MVLEDIYMSLRTGKSWLSDATGVDWNLTKSVVGSPASSVSKPVSSAVQGTRDGTEKLRRESEAIKDMGFQGPTNTAGRQAFAALQHGEKVGEKLTGATLQEAGEGRAQVRDRIEDMFSGNSAGASALKQDQNQDLKALKSQQAISGGGQMSEGQQQALKRQSNLDYAKFVSGEKRQAVSDQSREFRGVVSDSLKASGQYASMMTGTQTPAQASSGGLTVICTELNRQGLLPSDLYEKDQEYGRQLRATNMEAYVGYYVWAVHVAKWMSESKLLTTLVKYPTLKWARHIAGDKNILGYVLEKAGLKVCKMIGNLYLRRSYEKC